MTRVAEEYRLSTLLQLEAERIQILREVVAEFETPVMGYSVGKDSSVMVRRAHRHRGAHLAVPSGAGQGAGARG